MKKLYLTIMFVLSIFVFTSCKIDDERLMLPASENYIESGFVYDGGYYPYIPFKKERPVKFAFKCKVINDINDVKLDLYYGFTANYFGNSCDSYKICVDYGENHSKTMTLLEKNESLDDESYLVKIDKTNNLCIHNHSEIITIPKECFNELSGHLKIYIEAVPSENFECREDIGFRYLRIGETIQFISYRKFFFYHSIHHQPFN